MGWDFTALSIYYRQYVQVGVVTVAFSISCYYLYICLSELKIRTDELHMQDRPWLSFEYVRLVLTEIHMYELVHNYSVSLKRTC